MLTTVNIGSNSNGRTSSGTFSPGDLISLFLAIKDDANSTVNQQQQQMSRFRENEEEEQF